ncbi:MAG: RNA-binding S4 domain-containing protein [Candidatus Binatia bacterium]
MREREAEGDTRLDKWLWAVRFFKTRTLAAEAVTGGKVHLNGARVKPGRVVRIGDELKIRRGPYEWVVIVRGLGKRRGPASQAELQYEETEQSRQNREALAVQLRAQGPRQPGPKGRPSKKARREIIRFTRGDW